MKGMRNLHRHMKEKIKKLVACGHIETVCLVGNSFVRHWRNTILPEPIHHRDVNPSPELLSQLKVGRFVQRFVSFAEGINFLKDIITPGAATYHYGSVLKYLVDTYKPSQIIMDILSNKLAVMTTPLQMEDYDPANDYQVIQLVHRIIEFCLKVPSGTTVVVLGAAARKGKLSFSSSNKHLKLFIFEQRRQAVHTMLKTLEYEVLQLGSAPANFRFHKIPGWNLEEFSSWCKDGVHPYPELLFHKYTRELKKAILARKNNPVIMECRQTGFNQFPVKPTGARSCFRVSKRVKKPRSRASIQADCLMD